MKLTPSSILESIINDKSVSIEKFRQLALIAGASPQSFFSNSKGYSYVIENKRALIENFLNEELSSYWLSYIPVTIRKVFGSDDTISSFFLRPYHFFGGNNRNTKSNVLKQPTSIAFGVAILYYILKKGYTRYKISKLISKTNQKDAVHKIKLFNEGDYNGCLRDDYEIHQIFKTSNKNHESLGELRYRLLKDWKTSYFGENHLISLHLVRENGSIRDTAEEIGNSINYHKEFLSYGNRMISYLMHFVKTRRKSSQKYLKKTKRRIKSL